MNTEQNKVTKTDLSDVAQKVTKHPVFKFAVATGGVILLCYGSILAMNLITKIILANNRMKEAKSKGAEISKQSQGSIKVTDK